MPGIREVAEAAGVSVATVSHVLNGTRKVRPATEERVRAAVARLGYTPNAAARNLATGHSQMLALIVSDIRNPFFPEMAAGFQDRALLAGMEVVVMTTNYDSHRTLSCVRRVIGLHAPGVAVLTSQIDPSAIDALAGRKIPAVYLELGRVAPRIGNIIVECETGIADAVAHLCGLGHRRIGYIGGPLHIESAVRRRDAFLAACEAGGAELRTVDADWTIQGGYFACSRLITGFPATAVVAANDLMAIGAMQSAHDRGLRVPHDLSITGFDDIAFAASTLPALTTVHVPRNEIGCLAFRMLEAMLAGGPGTECRVPTRLVVRESAAPPLT